MQSGVKTLPNESNVTIVEYHPEFSTLCSVGHRPFYGRLDIRYRPDQKLLEFESFDTWLSTLALQAMTIEDVVRRAFDVLSEALGDIPLRVTVHARTTVHAPASAIIERGDV